jgi:hypothetical protein
MQEGTTLGAPRDARLPIKSASVRTGVKDVGSSALLILLAKSGRHQYDDWRREGLV